ncbi:hypothetical protein HU200_039029 [Digitaria exilis]|uniref:Small auxin up regulated protein n=1 Tax=Digitaria exilis TaxID=1010633 RepID=A0A835BB58_9POAL|nr:hypothetical protein HU200_039029 [Digitaria exilis]
MATPSPPSHLHNHSLGCKQGKRPEQIKQQTTRRSPDRLANANAKQAIMCKVAITIPSLACLRRALRRWRSRADAAVSSSAAPAGRVAVSVEGRRFVVRMAHLGHRAFVELLRRAEEEHGFPPATAGPIALPCDEDHFLHRVSSPPSSSSCCCGTALKRRGDGRPLLEGMAVEKLVW